MSAALFASSIAVCTSGVNGVNCALAFFRTSFEFAIVVSAFALVAVAFFNVCSCFALYSCVSSGSFAVGGWAAAAVGAFAETDDGVGAGVVSAGIFVIFPFWSIFIYFVIKPFSSNSP